MTSPPLAPEQAPSPSPAAWLAAVVGVLLTLAVFYPGFLSYDSIEALKQARSGNFGDWYPPLMAWVWQRLEWLVVGPLGMLLVQAFAWWGGLVLIITALAPRRLVPWLVLLVGCWPPIFAMIGTIWKDVQMAAAFTLAAGWLILAARTRTSLPVWGALILLIYGTALRHNAITAVLPLAIWCGILLARRHADGLRLRPALVAALAVLVVAVAPRFINQALVRVPDVPVQQVLFGYDLWGISVYAEKNLLPAKVQPHPYTVAELTERYRFDSSSAAAVHYTPFGLRLKFVSSQADVAAFQAAWIDGIRTYPMAYMAHRWQLFVSQAGLDSRVYYPFHGKLDPNPLGVEWTPSKAYEVAFRGLIEMKDSFIFRLWPYLLVLGACAAAVAKGAWRREPDAMIAMAFATCGLCYYAPYFLISPAADLRYNLWTMMCMFFALFAAIQHRTRLRLASGAPAASGSAPAEEAA